MRLIDADTLVQDLTESAAKAPNDFIKAAIYTIIQVIRKAPTAFDVEKVAAQLEEEKGDALCCTGDYEDFDPYYQGMANAYQQSIEIIREHREEPKK